MGWSITPSDLASIDSNGHVTFSRHTEDIVYTVTYSDANFTCSKAITVHACRPDCLCENVDLQAEATAGGNSIPAEGYDTDTVIGTYDNGTCLTSIGVSKGQDDTWVTSLSVSNGNVYAQIDPNTSLEHTREATITVSGKDAYDVTCTDDFPITQEMSAVTCTCKEFTVSPREGCVPVSAGTNNIGTYTDGGCVTDIAAYNLPDWLSNVNFSNGTISGTVTKNEGTAKREATISVSGSAAGNTCTRDLYVCQDPGECVTGITYAFPSRTIPCDKDNHITIHAGDGDITATTTYIDSSGKCATSSYTFTNKSIWCPGGDNDYCISANTGGDRPFSYDVYLTEDNGKLYLGSSIPGSIKVGTITGTQLECPPCNEGTDNTCVRGEINFGSTAGAHEFDKYINGMTAGCSPTLTGPISYSPTNLPPIAISATFDYTMYGVTGVLYQLDSDNPYADIDKYATYRITISDSCTGGTNNLCKYWDVCFHQSPGVGCGCNDLQWQAGTGIASKTDTSILLGRLLNSACADGVRGVQILEGEDWITGTRDVIEGSYISVYADFNANTTGQNRTAKFKVLLPLIDQGSSADDCKQYPEFTQEG